MADKIGIGEISQTLKQRYWDRTRNLSIGVLYSVTILLCATQIAKVLCNMNYQIHGH